MINQVSKGLKKSNTFWLASDLVEVEAVLVFGSWMPTKLGKVLPLLINVRKCAGSLFISGFLSKSY